MYKFHDTTTRMRTHTHDHRLQSDINTILIITNQVEITITIITISSVDTQHQPLNNFRSETSNTTSHVDQTPVQFQDFW